MRRTAEAVIIGGGIHGCSLAYHLAAGGLEDVVLLEASYLASGATGRCVAGYRHQYGTEVNIRLSMLGVPMWLRLQEELGYWHSIEVCPRGYLILTYRKDELELLRRNMILQKTIDSKNTTVILTPEEVRDVHPGLNIDGLVGASFNPNDGSLNPFHGTQAYAEAALRKGVDIMTYTPATGINVRAGRVRAVETERGDISTPLVINCAGPHGAIISSWVGLDMPLVPERHQVLVTEPVERIGEMAVINWSAGNYFFQLPNGSLLFGYADPEKEPKGFDQGSTWWWMEEVCRRNTELMPCFREATIIRAWSGLYDVTPDEQPIIGPTEVEGYYTNFGWSGHGMQFGPPIGKILSQMILGEKMSVDISCFAATRFATGELCPEPMCV